MFFARNLATILGADAQILSVLRGFLLMIPIAFASAYLWKMTGVWAAYPLTEMAAAVMGYLMYRRYKKT